MHEDEDGEDESEDEIDFSPVGDMGGIEFYEKETITRMKNTIQKWSRRTIWFQ